MECFIFRPSDRQTQNCAALLGIGPPGMAARSMNLQAFSRVRLQVSDLAMNLCMRKLRICSYYSRQR
jgi:hypothetical protein